MLIDVERLATICASYPAPSVLQEQFRWLCLYTRQRPPRERLRSNALVVIDGPTSGWSLALIENASDRDPAPPPQSAPEAFPIKASDLSVLTNKSLRNPRMILFQI